MYANLRVTIPPDGEVEYAWKVEVEEDGTTVIHLEDPDAEGHAPNGTRTVDAPVTIEADF